MPKGIFDLKIHKPKKKLKKCFQAFTSMHKRFFKLKTLKIKLYLTYALQQIVSAVKQHLVPAWKLY